MKRNRLLTTLLLVSMLVALALAACAAPPPAAPSEPAASAEEAAPAAAATEAPAAEAPAEEAAGPVELRFMFYQDANEAEIMQPLVDKFNADNPDIVVKLDVVPYKTIDEQLPIQAKAGEAPDLARITNFGAFRGLLLDLRPLLKDPAYFEANFPAPVLAAMRGEGDVDGLHGFPQTLTVTGPFANKTLFDQAGVALPGEGATWADWAAATKEVAEKTGTPYALTIDRTGHRLASPVLSEGATLLTSDGKFTVDTPGFRAFAEELKKWHDEGLAPKEIWLASENTPCINLFKSAQLVFCLSGSWQTGGLAKDVGDAFDWVAVPTPSGAGGSVGIAGGDGIVAFASTQHPEAVARFMEYLVQPEVYSEFSAGTLSLPAHAAVAEQGVEFKTDDPQVAAALTAFTASIPKISEQGWALNVNPYAFAYYRNAATRISQYIGGELTLDEALTNLQKDIDDAIAAGS